MLPVRVLIVDDNGVIRDALRGILRRHTDIVIVGEAVNGREALDKVASLDPDVILMDAQMPHMDGLEATKWIKQHDPARRIVFMAVYPSFFAAARAVGADALILKDCPREELIQAIRGLAATA